MVLVVNIYSRLECKHTCSGMSTATTGRWRSRALREGTPRRTPGRRSEGLSSDKADGQDDTRHRKKTKIHNGTLLREKDKRINLCIPLPKFFAHAF